MSRRRGGLLFTLILGTMPQLGCVTLPSLGRDETPPLPAPESTTPVNTELPPDLAAEACLAAAREMEKHQQPAEAIAQYEKARQNNPKLTQVSRRLAVLYEALGDFEKAAVEYRQALALHPRDVELLNDMGYFCYEREDWVEAEKWLRKAVALDPKHQRAWVNLGMTLAQQGRASESYEAFVRVLSPAQAHSNLGILLAQQGKTAEAIAALHQALALQPDLKPAQVVLARLEKAPAGQP